MNKSSETAGKKLSGQVKGYLLLIFLVILSWGIFKIITPNNFGSAKNMLSYFEASLLASVGAVGFYFVMVMGMFDFSIGANIMLSAIVGCVFANRFGLGYIGLIVGAIFTGALVGLLNGIFYAKLRIPSMIVTTGLALIYESIANYIAGGVEQTLPSDLRAFGQMPGNLILAVIAFVIAYLLLNYTKVGTYTYAIGSNEFVAKNMGINVNFYKVLVFVISGAFLGIMAVLTISYGSSMVAVTGMASMSRNFVPTMGCFFGLAFKKYGMPLPAIIIGEFVINIIFFGFIALGAPTAIQDVITGFALLIIVTLTTKVAKGEIVK
ncbi:MAG: ABC transporter permease [Eubacterium sp.]|nr:ABC transporter permease [Eubacterium sp.]